MTEPHPLPEAAWVFSAAGTAWAAKYGRDVAGAWTACPRADWLLLAAGQLLIPHLARAAAAWLSAAVTCAVDVVSPPEVGEARRAVDAVEEQAQHDILGGGLELADRVAAQLSPEGLDTDPVRYWLLAGAEALCRLPYALRLAGEDYWDGREACAPVLGELRTVAVAVEVLSELHPPDLATHQGADEVRTILPTPAVLDRVRWCPHWTR